MANKDIEYTVHDYGPLNKAIDENLRIKRTRSVWGYAKSVAGFVGRNGEAIRTGIGIVKDLVQTGSTIAQITGLIQPKTKSQIDSIADAIHKHSQATKPKPVGAKKGGLIII